MRHQAQAACEPAVGCEHHQRLLQHTAQLEPVGGGQPGGCGQPALAGGAVKQHIKPGGHAVEGAGVGCVGRQEGKEKDSRAEQQGWDCYQYESSCAVLVLV